MSAAAAACSSAHPGRPDADYLRAYDRFAQPLLRALWPATLHGRQNLPAHDDYLLIANHSGLGVVESVVSAGVWAEHVGFQRPLAPMVHPALFRLPGLSNFLRGIGAVEATREGAAHARARGAALLLFPGGDHESARPFWAARRVDFAGRRGWIRLARELGLTILPLAISGSHVTLPTLGHSKALAWLGPRLFGVKRVPLPVLSLAGAVGALFATRGAGAARRLGWAAAAFGSLAFVPFVPSRIGFHLLPALRASELACPDESIYQRVTDAIGAVLRDA